jgi:hypothetical protein
MSKTIIAIEALRNKGKTSTLRELAAILKNSNGANVLGLWKIHPQNGSSSKKPKRPKENRLPNIDPIPGKGDFRLVIEVSIRGSVQIVAVESCGDPGTELIKRLDDIINGFPAVQGFSAVKGGPDVIFCAVHPRGSDKQGIENLAKKWNYDYRTAFFLPGSTVLLPHGHPSTTPRARAVDDANTANELFKKI